MDARADLRTTSAEPRPSQRFEPRPAPPAPRVGALAAQAVWLGLASAWLELAAVLGHRAVVGTVTRVSYRHHWFRVPLSVPAHLAILAAWLGLTLLLRRRLGRMRGFDRATATLALFLATVSPLLAIEELYWPCSLVLAAGLAARLAPAWASRRSAILRRSLPALAIGSAVTMVGSFAWLKTAESRMLAALPAARPGAPNVALIVLDTVRADHLSLYGYGRDTTPNLKALADRAVVFDLARAPAPWTLPSHASMFTGRWPHELSVDTDRPLSARYPTIAGFLADHGYATAGFTGNTFYTNAWFGIDRGFAHYEDATENRTLSVQETLRCAALTRVLMPVAVWARAWPSTAQHPARKRAEGLRRDALAWLDGPAAKGRPFFLFLNVFDAHDPYIVPQGFPVKYSWEDRVALHQVNRRYNGHATDDDARPATGQPAADPELTRIVLDAYDDCLRYVDDQVARLVAELESRGRDRDTWIIVTADHGEQFGDHGFYRHGGSLYRGEIDVPLLVIPPKGAATSGRVAAPVTPRDLPATVADLAGLGSASPFPGRSLRRFWDGSGAGESASMDDAPLSELKVPADHLNGKGGPGIAGYRTAVVAEGHIHHASPIATDELYDVNDRGESLDLAPRGESASVLARFRNYLDRLRVGP